MDDNRHRIRQRTATATLPNQMTVSGWAGKGYVNSYHGGDASTGTLTSPPFKIERKYLNFLIGGGCQPQLARINLIIDSDVAQTETGKSTSPLDTERLSAATWNVANGRQDRAYRDCR